MPPGRIAGGHLRAVLDTNVIVSGLISPSGPPAELLDHWRDGAFEAVACGALLSEVAAVTLRPRLASRIAPDDRNEILDFMVSRSRFVPDSPPTAAVQADPDDDYLVTLASTWGAALVTGDRHLLDLPGMPAIMRPSAFLRLVS